MSPMPPNPGNNSTPALVIFDMDEVLFRFSRKGRLDYLARITGLASSFIHETIWASGFDDECDAGRFTARETHRIVCEKLGVNLSPRQWIEARARAMTPIEGVWDLARRVGKNAVLTTLTNNGPLIKAELPYFFPRIREVFGERFLFSCDFQTCKPEPAVFQGLLATLGYRPEEAFFIDDDLEYVEGARREGLRCHHYRTIAGLRKELAGMGLL